MTRTLSLIITLGALLTAAPVIMAQEEVPQEVSVQGTGFFTKDSAGNRISQHATDSGGFLVGYRFHFNRWLAAQPTTATRDTHSRT
jgi:hypothetical protein